MKGYQTPLKEQSRQSDFVNRRSKESQLKKPQKVAKKSLNAVFSSVSEDFSPEIAKESAEFSPISEILDTDFSREIAESHALALDPPLGASSEPLTFSDLTPSSTITINKNECDLSPDHFLSNRSECSKIGSVEVDVVVNLLKQARNQVSNSIDTDTRSKKLLDALIKIVLDEFYMMPEEKDHFTELLVMKIRIALACFLIWIFVVSVILFFNTGSGRSLFGPLPT